MVLLAVVVILFLTLSLLGLQFYHYLEGSKGIALSGGSYKYFVFLAIIILLFCAYMVTQHRRIANLSKAFLKEKETVAALSRDVKTLGALFEVSASISSRQKLGLILKKITHEIMACFDADHASLMLVDRVTNTIKTHVTAGRDSEFVDDAIIPIGKSVAGHVVKSGNPLLLNGQVNPMDFPDTVTKTRNITSAMCLPLKIRDQGIGVLNLNLIDRNRTFTENEMKLMAVFANNAAAAINDARLYGRITTLNNQLEEKVKARTRELELANRIKSNFLSSVSHEMRTPLNAIIGFSKVLQSQTPGVLEDDQKKHVDRIVDSGQRLGRIIDAMLEIASLTSGDFSLNLMPVRAADLLQSAVNDHQDLLQSKKLQVQTRMEASVRDATVETDGNRLLQIIGHLFSNAVKFSSNGGQITLSAELTESRDRAGVRKNLKVDIADNGSGINTEEQEKIFDLFYQVKGGIADKTSGIGAGLSIGKALAELMGGSLTVNSQGEGQGSRFRLEIPVQVITARHQ